MSPYQTTSLLAVSTLATVLIVVAVVFLLFFLGGVLAVRARDRKFAGVYSEHVAAADHALEAARAADRGWDRDVMIAAAAAALEERRPGWAYENLHLVLVDDRPGVDEDRARFVAMAGNDEVHVAIRRAGGSWVLDDVK